MNIEATVYGNTISLPKGSQLPDGPIVRIEAVEVPTTSEKSVLGRCLADFTGIADDVPSDLARNHDLYIHRQTKKS